MVVKWQLITSNGNYVAKGCPLLFLRSPVQIGVAGCARSGVRGRVCTRQTCRAAFVHLQGFMDAERRCESGCARVCVHRRPCGCDRCWVCVRPTIGVSGGVCACACSWCCLCMCASCVWLSGGVGVYVCICVFMALVRVRVALRACVVRLWVCTMAVRACVPGCTRVRSRGTCICRGAMAARVSGTRVLAGV